MRLKTKLWKLLFEKKFSTILGTCSQSFRSLFFKGNREVRCHQNPNKYGTCIVLLYLTYLLLIGCEYDKVFFPLSSIRVYAIWKLELSTKYWIARTDSYPSFERPEWLLNRNPFWCWSSPLFLQLLHSCDWSFRCAPWKEPAFLTRINNHIIVENWPW